MDRQPTRAGDEIGSPQGYAWKVRGCGWAPGKSRQRLRLPKALKTGTYVVKIAFKPTATSWSAAGKAKVILRR